MTNLQTKSFADGDHQTLTCDDDVELSFRLWKRPSQEAILFIHGLGSHQEQFRSDAEFFAGTGFCAATLDLRGHGLSSIPNPCTRSTLTVEHMAGDVLNVLERIPAEKVHIFGNSLGGLIALKILESHPERIASLVTGGTSFWLRALPGTAILTYGLLKLFGPERLAKITAKQIVFNDEARPLVQRLMGALNLATVRHIQSNIAKYDYEPIIRKSDIPLLILRGEYDNAINKRLDVSWKRLSYKDNLMLKTLPGVGHFTNLDDPKQFRTALLSFFSQIAAETADVSNVAEL